ncbi:membrane protein [Actinomycetota bacterium]|nr:membrane protein [Actinomycetota bacterium]
MAQKFDRNTLKAIAAFQKAEATDMVVYSRMAKLEKHDEHADILQQIANDEAEHYQTWKTYTKQEIKPNHIKATWYSILLVLLGYTFVLRLMERGEQGTAKAYAKLPGAIPEVQAMIANELEHEDMLIGILDEERLKYVGAIVLGLSDALVELTGTLAGLSLALANTRLIAMAGIITGIAATLSMAASNYQAEKAEHNPHALKASLYTGFAYLGTVIVLIVPYLLFPEDMYVWALATMLIVVILVILAFNFYVSVAQKLSFWSRFGQMAAISLGVAAISFVIGLAAKAILGVDV